MLNLPSKLMRNIALLLTKRINEWIKQIAETLDLRAEFKIELKNLNNVHEQSYFKTICSISNDKFVFFSKHRNERKLIVKEIANYLNVKNSNILTELILSSFNPQNIGKQFTSQLQNLNKFLNIALFCVNINIGNNKSAKIIVKNEDNLEQKALEFIEKNGLERSNFLEKVLNLLRKLYKKTIQKKLII
jgi:hypothetical protein